MDNVTTFVPVGVKAEDAPHVVMYPEDGPAEVKPVVGWFGLTAWAFPAVIVEQAAKMLDDGDYTLHASRREAELAAKQHGKPV